MKIFWRQTGRERATWGGGRMHSNEVLEHSGGAQWCSQMVIKMDRHRVQCSVVVTRAYNADLEWNAGS